MGLWNRLFRRTDADGKSDEAQNAASPVIGERDYDRGIRLFDAGRYTEAIAAFETVLHGRRLGPLVERLARFYLAESHSALALTRLRDGDQSEEAIHNLETAIALNPGYADLHFRLGSALLKRGSDAEAIQSLRRAIEINPRYYQALLHLAVALLRLPTGDAEEALRLAARAVEQGTDAQRDELEAARTAVTRGERKAAASTLAALIEAPEDDQSLVLAAEALDRFRQGDYAAAEANYRAALTQKPRYADLQNQLGVTLFAQDRHEEALAAFDAALALNPRYAEAHLNRGFVLLRLGNEDEALESVRLAMELDPDNAVMMVRLKKMFPQL